MSHLHVSPTVIAIVGPSGAGKSTAARHIAESTGAAVVNFDAFLLEKDRRPGLGLLNKYDLGEAEYVVDELRAGRAVHFVGFDQGLRQRVDPISIEPAPTIVVEGTVPLFSDHLCEIATLRLYVDAPTELREARQLRRLDLEGWYQGLDFDDVQAAIPRKRDEEDPLIARQKPLCHWVLSTATGCTDLAGAARATTTARWVPVGVAPSAGR